LKRVFLILFCISIWVSLSGSTYYISPDGKDSNPGTISQPFYSLSKAWTVVNAGDLVYLRGGTYKYSSQQYLIGKNGNSDNYIKIFAYPGETPLITRPNSSWTYNRSGDRAGIYVEGDYLYFKGIELAGFTQISPYMWSGMEIQRCNHSIFETINCHDNGVGLILSHQSDDNLILNCDFHHNFDPISSVPYDNADGVSTFTDEGTTNTFRGCRSWNNSDDGYDTLGSEGLIIFDQCWSWMSGYREDGKTPGGNGMGFKFGAETDRSTEHLRTLTNCIAFNNRAAGIAQNEGNQITWAFNNTAYHNADKPNEYDLNFEFDCGTSIAHILRNNISYANQHPTNLQANWDESTIQDHNTWNGAVTLNDADFLSLDSTGVSGPRGTDGKLPDLNFLKLKPGSDLIDAGTDVGIAYNGNAPDLGAFEFQSGVINLPAPMYASSCIENATPSLLEMTYSLTLANVAPAGSAFSVKVNSAARSVNTVAISGAKVQLSLTSPVTYGDVVSIAYTQPAANPLQTAAGGKAASISTKSVTNNCIKVSTTADPPVVVVNFPKTIYAGFISEIDATSTYDPNNDPLTVGWTVPDDVPVSTVKGLKTQFLAPVTQNSSMVDFQLIVSNGKISSSKDISINVLPYKPELSFVRIINIETSDSHNPDYPLNILDGNTSTKWSSNGDNNWLITKFAGPFKISHFEMAFLSEQNYSSYFDIYASKDHLIWEPILTRVASCSFTGDRQIFDVPDVNKNTEYLYVKYVGHGNSLNSWNYLSELKIFGSPGQNSVSEAGKKRKVIIYPNPASDFLTISIEDPTLQPDLIRIIDFSGKIVYEKVVSPDIKNVQFPLNLNSGIYYINLSKDRLTLFDQKLIVKN
jgi:uncharacterized repeat protein (TIGR02059 family)